MNNGYISLVLDNKTYQIATMNLTNKINKRGLNTFTKDLRSKLIKHLDRQSFDQNEPFGKMVHSGCINTDGLIEHFKVLSSKRGMLNQDIGSGITRYVEEVISIMDQIVTKTKELYFVNNNFSKLRSNVLKLLNTIFAEEFLITPILVSNKTIDLDHDRLFNNQQNILTLAKIYRETGLFITTKTLLPIIRLQSIYVYNDIVADDEEELITKAEFNENMVDGFTKWLKKLAKEESQRLENMPLDEKLKELGLDKDRLVNIKLNLKDGEEVIDEDIHIFMSELDQILFSKVLKPMGKVSPHIGEVRTVNKMLREMSVPPLVNAPVIEQTTEQLLQDYEEALNHVTESIDKVEQELNQEFQEPEAQQLVDTPTIIPEFEITTPVTPPVTQPTPPVVGEEEIIEEIKPTEPKIYNNITIEAVPSIEKYAQRKSLIELIEFKLKDPELSVEEFDKIMLFKDYLDGRLDFKDPICDFYEDDSEEYPEEEEEVQAYLNMSKKDLEEEIYKRVKEEISRIQLKLPYQDLELTRPHTPVPEVKPPVTEQQKPVQTPVEPSIPTTPLQPTVPVAPKPQETIPATPLEPVVPPKEENKEETVDKQEQEVVKQPEKTEQVEQTEETK